MAGPVSVRIPVLENFAAQYGDIFSTNARPLTPEERQVAEPIFMQSINFDAVRVVTTTLASAPTTLGNYIRILPGYKIPNATLVHELTHIWQYQTKGNGYISSSLVSQTCAILSTGDRNGAYDYKIAAGQSITRYNAEQQAMIVEDYYTDRQLPPKKQKLQDDPEYIRLINEVRSARPNLTDMDRYQESLYGTQFQNTHFFDPVTNSNDSRTNTVTILRIEFD